jgi:2-methylcitrate dehydratase PrpD
MTSLSHRLAEQAMAEVTPAESDLLRTMTLTNIAAGAGYRGDIDRVITALPMNGDPSPGSVAYVLGAKLHARTQDDFYPEGRSHIGAVALAASLGLADEVGDRTLECLAAGYRVMCAASEAYSAEAQARGLRPSGLFGPLGAAASAAAALRLERDEFASALGIAAALSGGTNQAWLSGSDEWMLQVGLAARTGVESALLARDGATGSDEALDGRAGWGAAFFSSPGAPVLDKILEKPIDISGVSIKPFPISGISQIHTALACEIHTDLAGMRPKRVRVHVSEGEYAYPGSANVGPFRSRSDALMSIAFCVSCALLDGTVRLDRLERPNDVDVAALLETLDVYPDPAIEHKSSRIEVDVDGRTIVKEGRADDILHPTWRELSADPLGLAHRCEVDFTFVKQAIAVLSANKVDARELRPLLFER